MSDVHVEAEQLRQKIEDARRAYYDGMPIMSDKDYDGAYKRLLDIEKVIGTPPHSPSLRVGSGTPSGFDKVKHNVPMLSLDNLMTEGEARSWSSGHFPVTLEVKLDGIALSVFYHDGKFLRAVTRGDGVYGEDVTENARTIRNLPMYLVAPYPRDLEVRGEVVFLSGAFNKMNEERKKAGLETFANPRNAAVGAMKQKDSRECAKRPISFIAYSLHCSTITHETQMDVIGALHRMGFQLSNTYKLCENFDELQQFYDETLEVRQNLPYEVDGMVIKVNSIDEQIRMGSHSTAPRWAAAYKFPHMSGDSVVEKIDLQVGRTGSLTPVARIKPVHVCGVTITNVTLHNPDEIKRLGINVGSRVEVARSGDVIPKIVKVYNPMEPWDDKNFDKCPVCGSPTDRSYVVPTCTGGENCPAQKNERLYYFTSVMGMRGIGPAFVDQMIDKGLVNNYLDFFSFTQPELVVKGEFGPGQSAVIIDAVEMARSKSHKLLLAAIGLDSLAESTAGKIVEAHDLRTIVMDGTLPPTKGVSDPARKAFNNYFRDKNNANRFLQMMDILTPKVAVTSSSKLAGKSFCFTGTLSKSRSHFQQLVRDNGGIVFDSIKSNLNFLVVGEKAGGKKADAEKRGITCIDEATFMGMI